MKLSVNFFVIFYIASWILGITFFVDFQLINIIFLSVSIIAILLIFAIKRKEILMVD